MDCLPEGPSRPYPRLRSHLLALALLAMASAAGCRPAKVGPVPWNVLVVTLDGLTPEHLSGDAAASMPLLERATRFENAHTPSGQRRRSFEALWFGDSSGAASGLESFPKRLHKLGIVSAAIITTPQDSLPAELLACFDRVETLVEGDFHVEGPSLLAEGLNSWLVAANQAGIGPWLLWLHGDVLEEGPAAIYESLEQTLQQHSADAQTLIVLTGLPTSAGQTQIPLAISSPEVGAEWEQEPVALQDIVPTLAERLSQRLFNEDLAQSKGDGISLCAALLGLPIERKAPAEEAE